MHRHIKIAIVTGLALTVSACGGRHRGPADLDKDETLLQVSATGQSESKPDEANFAIGVSSIAATSEAATAANNARINAVVAALKALDVRDADMQTRQVGASRIEWGPNRNKFEANNSLSIRMRDVSKAGAAIQAATRAGANILSGPDLRVSDPEAASRGAYASAYKAARARADAYAGAAGMKVVRILAIRDGGGAPVPQASGMYDTANMESARAAPPPVLAGTDRSLAGVSVDFVLGPK